MRATAAGLQTLGVAQGDPVLIMLPNGALGLRAKAPHRVGAVRALPTRPAVGAVIGVPVDRPLNRASYNFPVARDEIGMPQQIRNQQRLVHDEPAHDVFPKIPV